MKKRGIILISITIILIILFIALYSKTGIFQSSKINERDLERWNYTPAGIIQRAEEFTLHGSNETCWYMIHGYTSTPDELRGLAEKINKEFNDTVFVTRLKGHGEVPSHILNLNLYDWFEQTNSELNELSEYCGEVNLVGFSFGGALSTRLAEENEVGRVYLLAPYIFANYELYYIFKLETYIDMTSGILKYSKKAEVGQINSPEGLAKHIAYVNMPYAPIKNSIQFFKDVKENLNLIEEPVLLQQSKNDRTSGMKSSEYILEHISSKNKELIVFEKSNHILIEDYDKEEVTNNIINFEKEVRI